MFSTVKFGVSWELMEGMVYNFACWCFLTTFRTDDVDIPLPIEAGILLQQDFHTRDFYSLPLVYTYCSLDCLWCSEKGSLTFHSHYIKSLYFFSLILNNVVETDGILFSGSPSIYRPSFSLSILPTNHPLSRWATDHPSIHVSLGISWRMHRKNHLKSGRSMYPDHPQDWSQNSATMK